MTDGKRMWHTCIKIYSIINDNWDDPTPTPIPSLLGKVMIQKWRHSAVFTSYFKCSYFRFFLWLIGLISAQCWKFACVCECVWMLPHPEFGSCIDVLIFDAEVVTCNSPWTELWLLKEECKHWTFYLSSSYILGTFIDFYITDNP